MKETSIHVPIVYNSRKGKNYRYGKNINGCQKFEGRDTGWISGAYDIFRVAAIFHNSVMVEMRQHAFAKTHIIVQLKRMNTNASYTLSLNIVYQHQLINCNTCWTLI